MTLRWRFWRFQLRNHWVLIAVVLFNVVAIAAKAAAITTGYWQYFPPTGAAFGTGFSFLLLTLLSMIAVGVTGYKPLWNMWLGLSITGTVLLICGMLPPLPPTKPWL